MDAGHMGCLYLHSVPTRNTSARSESHNGLVKINIGVLCCLNCCQSQPIGSINLQYSDVQKTASVSCDVSSCHSKTRPVTSLNVMSKNIIFTVWHWNKIGWHHIMANWNSASGCAASCVTKQSLWYSNVSCHINNISPHILHQVHMPQLHSNVSHDYYHHWKILELACHLFLWFQLKENIMQQWIINVSQSLHSAMNSTFLMQYTYC